MHKAQINGRVSDLDIAQVCYIFHIGLPGAYYTVRIYTRQYRDSLRMVAQGDIVIEEEVRCSRTLPENLGTADIVLYEIALKVNLAGPDSLSDTYSIIDKLIEKARDAHNKGITICRRSIAGVGSTNGGATNAALERPTA